MLKRIALLVLTFIFIASCKSTKTIAEGSNSSSGNTSLKSIISNYKANAPQFKTLSGRLKISIEKGDKSQSNSVSFRMEKDKTIWMSKLGLVKAIITPSRLAFYNKLDNTYFDGDFSYLSDLLGTEIDFSTLQNMLLGETIFPLTTSDKITSTTNETLVITPKSQDVLFNILYTLNASSFKVSEQQITQLQEQRDLKISYVSYQNVDNEILPEITKINAVDEGKTTQIELELKSVSLNESLRFPFTIPSGFKAIEL